MASCNEATPPLGVLNHKPGGGGDKSELDVFAAERYFNGDDDALWCCARSSSSLTSLSSAFRTGTTAAAEHESDRSAATATAATSSSEASWNSRSALLPLPNGGKPLAADDIAANQSAVVEAETRLAASERPRGEASLSPPPPSSLLRRWLLGVAGCGCAAGGADDGDESVSADHEVGDGNVVAGIGGNNKRFTDGAGEMLQKTESKKELAVVGEATSVRVRPGRWFDDEEELLLTGKAAFSPVQAQLAGDGHRRSVNSGEFSTPILNLATTTSALLHEQRRQSSSGMLRPLSDVGNAQLTTKQHSSAFTIIAGKSKAAGGWSWSPAAPPPRPCEAAEEEDDAAAAASEEELVGCAYPPSEASVVWSVVTAEGAASCANFSSAASGYYYSHHFDGAEDGGAMRRSDRRRRRSGVNNGGGGGLLTCMGDKAVNVVGPARRMAHMPPDVMRRR